MVAGWADKCVLFYVFNLNRQDEAFIYTNPATAKIAHGQTASVNTTVAPLNNS
jgi:hypothetical protein